MFDVTHGTQKQRFQKYITQNKNQIKILYNFMQHAQIKRKVVLTSTLEMVRNSSMTTFDELVQKFIPESIGREIEKATSSIYPLQNVFIRKVKILKAPKFDLGKLMEVHGDYSEDVGVKMERPADEPIAEETEVIGA